MAAPARFASPSSAAAPPRVAPPSVASRAVVASRRASSAPRAVAAALLSGHRRLPVPRPPSHARAPASAQPREHLRAWRGCIPPGAKKKKHATFRTAAAAATTTTTDGGGGGEGDLVDGEPRDVAYDAETETRDAHRRLSRYDVLLMTPEDRAKVHKLKCFEGRVRAAEKRKRQMVRFAPPRHTVRPLGTRSLRVINRYWHQPDSSGSLGNARVIERNSSLGWRRARV
jgi:hypothetical protein